MRKHTSNLGIPIGTVSAVIFSDAAMNGAPKFDFYYYCYYYEY